MKTFNLAIKSLKTIRTIALAAVMMLLMTGFSISYANYAKFVEEYSFTVTNNTGHTIKQILVSEDGSDYGYFDIGSGIKPGQTVKLVWDQSTNGEACDQFVKAVYDDGSESEAAKFNFCENGVDLEFD